MAAVTCRFLTLLADFDARGGWHGWGIRSCAHWLSWKCGLDLRTAQEHVRVARALVELPLLRAAFGAGRISYSKARAIARVATPVSEPELVDLAVRAPAAQIERQSRRFRTVQRLNPGTDLPGVKSHTGDERPLGVRWRWDEDGTLTLWGRLSPADGAALLAAATRAGLLQDGDADAAAESSRVDTAGPGPLASRSAERSAAPVSSDPHGTADPDPAGSRSAERGGAAAQRRGSSPLPFRPPSDLAPALVTMANLVRAEVRAPIHAPAAEVVVVVDAATLAAALHESPGPDQAAESPAVKQRPAESSGVQSPGAESPGAQSPGAQSPGADQPPPRSAERSQPTPDAAGAPITELRPGHLDDGPALPAAVLAELACSGRIRLQVTTGDTLVTDGRTLDLGRAVRRPTTAQLAALWRRDRGCAVPGCSRARFLHAHHVVPWALGGPTNLDNLILLCGEHHRALHEGAFSITALGGQRFRFHGPNGAVRPFAPPAPPRIPDIGDVSGIADIGPTTIQPDWNGSGLPGWATAGYLAIWRERERRAQRRTARARAGDVSRAQAGEAPSGGVRREAR